GVVIELEGEGVGVLGVAEIKRQGKRLARLRGNPRGSEVQRRAATGRRGLVGSRRRAGRRAGRRTRRGRGRGRRGRRRRQLAQVHVVFGTGIERLEIARRDVQAAHDVRRHHHQNLVVQGLVVCGRKQVL